MKSDISKKNRKGIKKTTKPYVKRNAFEHFASVATHMAGSTYAFLTACLLIVGWVVSGPLFGFSDTWQLVINTGTTIITFLMVFLIQKTQNKDSMVIQIKLNELVAAEPQASNRIISVEDLTEEELITLNRFYTELAEMTKKETQLRSSHSIEEAREKHEQKATRQKLKTMPSNRPRKAKPAQGGKKPVVTNNGHKNNHPAK